MPENKLKNELKLKQWKAKFLPKELKQNKDNNQGLERMLKSSNECEVRFSI